MAPLIVAVEGLEGSGKSTVIDGLTHTLVSRGQRVQQIPEFSVSNLGTYLHQRLAADRFLRDPNVTRSAWTQAMAVAADTAYALEYSLTSTANQSVDLVIKDRYRESLVACQHVSLADEYEMSDLEAIRLLASLARSLPDPADILIWLDVPDAERTRRIKRRGDYVVGDEDIFRRRERAYRWLMTSPEWQWRGIAIDGTGGEPEVVQRVLNVCDLVGE